MKYKVQSNLAISESGFLFLPSTGETYNLNSIGKLILTNIQKELDRDSVIKEIVETYEIDKLQAEKDFDEFINQLISYNLIIEE